MSSNSSKGEMKFCPKCGWYYPRADGFGNPCINRSAIEGGVSE